MDKTTLIRTFLPGTRCIESQEHQNGSLSSLNFRWRERCILFKLGSKTSFKVEPTSLLYSTDLVRPIFIRIESKPYHFLI